MNLLSAVLILATLGLLTHFYFAARRPSGEAQPSTWWLDAIEGSRAPTKRSG